MSVVFSVVDERGIPRQLDRNPSKGEGEHTGLFRLDFVKGTNRVGFFELLTQEEGNETFIFGLNNNILSVLVLTGEATLDDVERGHIKPDIILDHAANLLRYL